MKLTSLAIVLFSTAAMAQEPPAPAAPVPAPAPAATPAPAAGTAKFTLSTTIETLISDPKAKAVLETNLPGLTSHPAFEQFKGMSLIQLQPYSSGVITDEAMKKVEADLATIG